jgi:membrane-bound serine protease (ClpP class)
MPSPTPRPSTPPGDQKPASDGGSPSERKVLNDAISYIKALAELRGRNAEWAEKAVREAATLTAAEALEARVTDVVATDLGDLLSKLHGRSVRMASGEQTLDVRNAIVVPIEPGWKTQLLTAITDPNIAFILLMIGVYGILFEFWSPGLTGPGVVGAICLIVALMALSAMPVSFAGLALLALGTALMAAEAFAPGFGILGLGGVVAFGLGAAFLFDPAGADIDFRVAWPVILSATLTSALLLAGMLGFLVRMRHRKVVSGSEEMIGLEGEVASWTADGGRVHVHGESWSARSASPLPPGTRVKVIERHGLTLVVAPTETRS